MKIKHLLSLLLIILPGINLFAQSDNDEQETGGVYPVTLNDASHPCITPAQYKNIEEQNISNCKMLGLPCPTGKNPTTTTFIWPLKPVNGLNDCSYYYIGNYLDQDTTSPGILDWNCGTVTYDGHQGTDICTYPYPFYKMDNDQVEVIAAAPGTIINKEDGHFDKNCSWTDSTANYIVVQHADGSCVMYWHMKKNSLTSKTLGQTVMAGEYLGMVGSSGMSSGPHLHFEVLSGITMNTLNDLYAGPCNSLNANSWWAVQKPYTEPAIIQASVHPVLAVFPTCPATETPNEDTCFTAGASVKFYCFYRNETSGLVCNMRIVNPDGSTFLSWSHNSNSSHLCSYWISTKTLPSLAGIYKFEAVYNNDTCTKQFIIDCSTVGSSEYLNGVSNAIVSPNPFSDKATIKIISDRKLSNAELKIFDVLGNTVKIISGINSSEIKIEREKMVSGIYFYNLTDSKNIQLKGNFIIQ